MKKILITTTALGMIAAGTAYAEGPAVTIGGFMDFQYGNRSQDSAYEGVNQRDSITQTNTELHINVDGKTDNGLKYGALIELEADVNPDDRTNNGDTNSNVERAHLYLESDFGRIEVGPTGDAGRALQVDASNIARASGGIWGDFIEYVNLDPSTYSYTPGTNQAAVLTDAVLITSPNLLLNGYPGEIQNKVITNIETANKINYYSPKFAGAQLGITYIPSLEDRGTTGTGPADEGDNYDIDNIWALALNYQAEYDQIGIQASLNGELGNAIDAGDDDLKAFAIGLSANFAGATVAGSYGDISEMGYDSELGISGEYFSLGAAYEFGPFATSITYLNSSVKNAYEFDPNTTVADNEVRTDAEFSNISLGADYQLAPGLVPYIEVSFFETDSNIPGVKDNDGTVFIAGTTLNF